MDHSLLVMGRIIENMAVGREILNILLHKKIMWRSCKSKVYLQPCEFDFCGGEGVGWGKSSCHKYLHYQTIVFRVIIILIVMIMLREIMQAIMCFCHYYHHFEAEKGVKGPATFTALWPFVLFEDLKRRKH